MKVIISEAYYQKKKWLFAQANYDAYQEKLRMTPEEQETAQKKIKRVGATFTLCAQLSRKTAISFGIEECTRCGRKL